MTNRDADVCCPPFDPAAWDGKTLQWERKRFVKDRVRSFLHIPLNYGAVMTRNMTELEAAGALTDPPLALSDENSLWGADIYFAVTKDVPPRPTEFLSGTFLAKVFEGPYKDAGKWANQMRQYAAGQGKPARRILFWYTTCPKCAKKYGRNYVVLLAGT